MSLNTLAGMHRHVLHHTLAVTIHLVLRHLVVKGQQLIVSVINIYQEHHQPAAIDAGKFSFECLVVSPSRSAQGRALL